MPTHRSTFNAQFDTGENRYPVPLDSGVPSNDENRTGIQAANSLSSVFEPVVVHWHPGPCT
jgi:hypothetical protein